MSAELDKLRDTFSDQLETFNDRLADKSDDVEMLADIHEGIGELLAFDVNGEADIRRLLQERYEAGSLREETFQLVKSMLDDYPTDYTATTPNLKSMDSELVQTSPSILDELKELEADDEFGSTTVISNDAPAIVTADSRVQVGSVLRDRFLLQEKVSGGSMGVVYKALDRRLAEAESEDPWVAIKVLSPKLAEHAEALRALQQEATKGRCLAHPNIVRFIDLDREDDLYFLVMEWLEGRSLADVLDTTDAKSIDRDTALRIVGQIGDALDYAHRCGIVHADVKPANIMLMPNGDVKLFDFGVARVRQKQSASDFDPGVLGALTPAYSSMQVLTNEEPTASDDVFSLACLMYRLVAGHRVFGPRNAAEASQEGMKPQRPQGLNDTQWRALKKALSYARVARFATVQDFLAALKDSGDDTFRVDVGAHEKLDIDEGGGFGKWLFFFIVLLGLAGAATYQLGILEPWLQKLIGQPDGIDTPEVLEPLAQPEIMPFEAEDDDAPFDELPVEATEPEAPTIEAEVVEEPLVDFSTLPPADVEVTFSMRAGTANNFKARLREDDGPVIIDFVRKGGLAIPLVLKLDEVGFSGNRSPWGSRQYSFSNSGIVEFPVGQDRSRIIFTMASDPLREADQLSTLRLREVDSVQSELAIIQLTLEDDDQRAFEAQLPVNTVAFAASQASIRETDPAVQIDIVRFNPDDAPVAVGFSVNDVTATESEDYFAPGNYSISFGPGQRSARLLIPLVQDSEVEGDEAFIVELATQNQPPLDNVYRRIVVMIRDDEPQIP